MLTRRRGDLTWSFTSHTSRLSADNRARPMPSLPELVDEPTLDRLFQRTRDGGAEIVALLKKGSAYYAPSASITQMVAAIANDTHEVLPVCAWATGEYGINDVYVGVPAKLGRGGVEEIVELDLNDDELSALRSAAEGIRVKCADLASL